jgi:hypothetical protein
MRIGQRGELAGDDGCGQEHARDPDPGQTREALHERAGTVPRGDHPGEGEQPVEQDDRDEAGIEQEGDDQDRGPDVTPTAIRGEGSVCHPQHQRE